MAAPTSHGSHTALVATLGGKPQVVTLALDCLLAQRTPIDRVIALHLSPSDPRLARALHRLEDEIQRHYHGRIGFDAVTIRDKPDAVLSTAYVSASGRAIERIDDRAAAHAIWLTVHRLITALHAWDYAIELCVTGGPRLIGLQTLSAASILFASHDRCWHLYTPPDLRALAGEGEVMHFDPHASGVRLIPVPLLPLGTLAPGLHTVATAQPEEIIAERARQMSAGERERCKAVLTRLTARQREVLREFAREGADVRTVADKLCISAATVHSHKARIFEECRMAWGLAPDAPLTHRFLHERFRDAPEELWVH